MKILSLQDPGRSLISSLLKAIEAVLLLALLTNNVRGFTTSIDIREANTMKIWNRNPRLPLRVACTDISASVVGSNDAAMTESETECNRSKQLMLDGLTSDPRRSIDSEQVQNALNGLRALYEEQKVDSRFTSFDQNDGDWIAETAPSFPGLLGVNYKGESLYTLGKLTFNMIRPTNLVCSVQKITQHIHPVSIPDIENDAMIPKKLMEQVQSNPTQLRTFRIDTHFTVETNGLQGVLSLNGYTIPDSTVWNKFLVWFTDGKCYANSGQSKRKWRETFNYDSAPKLTFSEKMRVWLTKLFVGAEPSTGLLEDDTLRYELRKPAVGYQNVIYLDDTMRITVGNQGSIVVQSRI